MRTPSPRTTVWLVGLLAIGAVVAYEYAGTLGPGADRGPSGLELQVPGHFVLRDLGRVSRTEALVSLSAMVAELPDSFALGVSHDDGGAQVTILADLDGGLIDERRVGVAGTVVRTLWHGEPRKRLAWGRTNGELDAPGWPHRNDAISITSVVRVCSRYNTCTR